jgi:hypothetical protein
LPLESVAPELGLSDPQVPEAVKVTVSPVTEVPPEVVTLALMVAVSVPLATTVDAGVLPQARAALVQVTPTAFGGAVCVMVAELLRAAIASVAVTVQLPVVVEAVYVVLALPVVSVETVAGLSPPQAAPDEVNRTESPETGLPLEVVTVAVTVDVDEPSA